MNLVGSSLEPHVDRFFERLNAEQKQRIGSRALFHATHSSNIADIQANGLQANAHVFPETHGNFIRTAAQSGLPHRLEFLDKFILGHRKRDGVYLTHTEPDLSHPKSFGVPQKLILLMGGLDYLLKNASLSKQDRLEAQAIRNTHYQRLTDVNAKLVSFVVDPLAPQVLNARLGHMPLDSLGDNEMIEQVLGYLDGNRGNDIYVPSDIDPQHLEMHNQVPFSAEGLDHQIAEVSMGWLTNN